MKFRPANSSEFESFYVDYCNQCVHNADTCQILGDSMFLTVDSPDYPDALKYDTNGRAICTQFTTEQLLCRCPNTMDMFDE